MAQQQRKTCSLPLDVHTELNRRAKALNMPITGYLRHLLLLTTKSLEMVELTSMYNISMDTNGHTY
jgi:hypothetical protein